MTTFDGAPRRATILAALVLPLVLVTVGLAQPGGFPRGPIGPRGPAGPGGFGPMMPRPPFGPNMPNMPGGPGAFEPNIPQPPTRPFNPGVPGLGDDTWEFRCQKCNAVVGTGKWMSDKHKIASCPSCGIRFDNTMAGMQAKQFERPTLPLTPRNPGAWDNRGDGPPGGENPPAPDLSNLGPSAPFATTPLFPPPPAGTGRRSTVVLIVFAVGGLLLLLLLAGIGGLVWMVTTAPNTRAVRQPRPDPRRRNDGYRPV